MVFNFPVTMTKGVKRVLIYTGPSRYTGEPILAWITTKSKNSKTGDMFTLWIVADHGAKSKAACGDCAQRDEACYAEGTPSMGARSSLKAIRKGSPGTVDARNWTLAEMREAFGAVILRNAGWGDSAALPQPLVVRLHAAAGEVRAYTHDASAVQRRMMLSVESAAAWTAGKLAGVRMAAVVPSDCGQVGGMPVPNGAVVCPAISTDGRVGCDRCTLCSGDDRPTAPHVVFPAHGPRAKKADKLARIGWGWQIVC